MSAETIDQNMARHHYARLGAIVGFVYALASVFTKEPGDTVFGMALGTNALLYEYALSPRDIINVFREKFQKCGRVARFSILVAAVGGTALAIDTVYNLSLLNQYLDPWAKRMGLPIVLLAIALLAANWISNRIYVLSSQEGDEPTRRYELPFYVMVCIFALTIFVLFLGLPVEDIIPSCKDPNYSDYPGCRDPNVDYYDAPNWSKPNWKAILTVNVITVVWLAALFICLWSRYSEWAGGVLRGHATISTGERQVATRKGRSGRSAQQKAASDRQESTNAESADSPGGK